MPMPKTFEGLRLPAIAARMFLTSGPDLVVEVCRSGLGGAVGAITDVLPAAIPAGADRSRHRDTLRRCTRLPAT
jgi:nitronate monooxygenase